MPLAYLIFLLVFPFLAARIGWSVFSGGSARLDIALTILTAVLWTLAYYGRVAVFISP